MFVSQATLIAAQLPTIAAANSTHCSSIYTAFGPTILPTEFCSFPTASFKAIESALSPTFYYSNQ